MSFAVGQTVRIPCSVEPGAFPGEQLITIQVGDERVSGFVRSEYTRDKYVLGTIVGMGDDTVTVHIPGSFFTKASGRTMVPAAWASANLQPAQA